MFKHYLLVAVRNFKENLKHSVISIVGLSLGLSAGIILLMIIYTECNYDKQWRDSGEIYQVENVKISPNGSRVTYFMSPKIRGILRRNFPDIEVVAGQEIAKTTITKVDEQENGPWLPEFVAEIDADFFKIFNFDIEAGSLEGFYSDINSAVISSNVAAKLFGDQNPIGRSVSIDISRFSTKTNFSVETTRTIKDYKVVAVFQPTDQRTSLPEQNIYIHFNNVHDLDSSSLAMERISVFFRIKENEGLKNIENLLPDVLDRSEKVAGETSFSPSQENKYKFIKIEDVHLYGIYSKNSNHLLVMLYLLVFVILSMAIVNYTNIQMASNSRRQREVALRKIMGASITDIAQQFFIESFFMVLLAFVLSLVTIVAVLPMAIAAFNLNIEDGLFFNLRFILILGGVTLMVVIASGLYPSLYLVNLNPANVLKSNRSIESTKDLYFKKFLIIIQFAISGVMLIVSFLMVGQLEYLQKIDRGYALENIVFSSHEDLFSADQGATNSLKSEVLKMDGVYSAAYTMSTQLDGDTVRVSRSDGLAVFGALAMVMLGSEDELGLYDIPLLAGRYPEPIVPTALSESESENRQFEQVLINQQALNSLGFKSAQEAINQSIKMELSPGNVQEFIVVGVTKKLHIGNLNQTSRPCVFWAPSGFPMRMNLAVRFNPEHRGIVLAELKKLWGRHLGLSPNFSFSEDIAAREFSAEKLIGKIVNTFTVISILISCLGIYSLASYMSVRRYREIALRKINGASNIDIVKLLLWQFGKLVMCANLIASPIAIFLISAWLNRFVNRLDILVWGVFYVVTVSALTVLIAWLTVGGNTYFAAKTKPIGLLNNN
jgi:putative ABC transport system permease protein